MPFHLRTGDARGAHLHAQIVAVFEVQTLSNVLPHFVDPVVGAVKGTTLGIVAGVKHPANFFGVASHRHQARTRRGALQGGHFQVESVLSSKETKPFRLPTEIGLLAAVPFALRRVLARHQIRAQQLQVGNEGLKQPDPAQEGGRVVE